MNVVDIAILGILALAVAHGVSQGGALQVLSFGGFWAGLWLGAALSPVVAGMTDRPLGTTFLALFTLFGLAVVGGATGRILGTHAWGALQRAKLGTFDSMLGAVVAGVATLVAVWLFAIILTAGPTPAFSTALRESTIVRTLVDRLPPAPSVFSRIQALVDDSPFPQVFAGFEPAPADPVQLPDDPTVRSAVEAAGQSTVKIVGLGCGGVQSGSGFVAASGLVVTNAHVVAGIDTFSVEERDGQRHRGTPVLFDPDLDVAVIRSDVGEPALPILRGSVERGAGGAILGYPGGGGFTAGPGAVLRQFQAVGRDIYGRNLTRRDVYQLQGQVQQGNSGGPFTRSDGQVIGVIFAASTSEPNVGYALTTPEVAARVDQAAAQGGAVDTGPCAS